MLVFQQVSTVYCHLWVKTGISPAAFLPASLSGVSTRPFTHFEGVAVYQDDGLKGGTASVGQLMERLLLAPIFLQQGVAHHAGRPFEARAEAKGNIRGRLGAAAVRQVHLEPEERSHDRDGSTKKVGKVGSSK